MLQRWNWELRRNPSGEALVDHANASYWNKYYKEGMEQILDLRMKSLDIENVDIESLSDVWNDSEGITERLCSDILKILDTEQKLTLVPLNLYNKHWVGIVIEKTEDGITIHYMDPEQQPMPDLLRKTLEAIGAQALVGSETLDITSPEQHINIIETELEPQKYNNCGPEVIENFIWYLTGSRLEQDNAVPFHSSLLEDSLMLVGEDCV